MTACQYLDGVGEGSGDSGLQATRDAAVAAALSAQKAVSGVSARAGDAELVAVDGGVVVEVVAVVVVVGPVVTRGAVVVDVGVLTIPLCSVSGHR